MGQCMRCGKDTERVTILGYVCVECAWGNMKGRSMTNGVDNIKMFRVVPGDLPHTVPYISDFKTLEEAKTQAMRLARQYKTTVRIYKLVVTYQAKVEIEEYT